MEINRSFSHRTFGAIGSVVLDETKGKWTLDGKPLPEASVAHLMTFALQTLQDAYAGAKSAEEAKSAFETKLGKLVDGTIGTRSGGGGVDERTAVMRSVVKAAMKAKFGAKSPEWAEFTGRSDEDQNAKFAEVYEANKAVFDPAIEDEMARRAARRAAKSDLAGSVEITL